jgi:hypothetical protein
MTQKLGIAMTVLVVLTVVAVGVSGYACGGHSQPSAQTAFGSGPCPSSCPSGGGAADCPYLKRLQMRNASNQMTENSCNSSAWYGANVYEVCDGRGFAVCQGREFEVGTDTPYIQIGNARYYLDSPALEASCKHNPSALTSELDREAVALASVDGNVVGMENGQKVARCPDSGRTFVVTPDSQIRVMDGQRFYWLEPVDLASAPTAMHR